jgi:hypothetical protein
MVDNIFKRLTNNQDFVFSRREYFTSFERQEFGHGKNKALTLISKFIIIYFWDCRNMRFIPEENNCWEFIMDKVKLLMSKDKMFLNIWMSSGLQNNFP